jgi:hypothetical protein
VEKMPHGIQFSLDRLLEIWQRIFDYHLPWMQLCEGVRCSNHCCSLPLWPEAGPPFVLETNHSKDSFLYKSLTACHKKEIVICHFSNTGTAFQVETEKR